MGAARRSTHRRGSYRMDRVGGCPVRRLRNPRQRQQHGRRRTSLCLPGADRGRSWCAATQGRTGARPTRRSSRLRRTVRLLMAIVMSWALLSGQAFAQTQIALIHDQWSSASITVSQSQHKISNTTGFWQTIVKSNVWNLCVDGDFGPATHSATVSFQSNVAGVSADGIVGPQTWNGTQYATFSGGNPRLVMYSMDNYWYYGGAASSTYLVKRSWNGIFQWGYRVPATSSQGTMHSSRRDVRTVSSGNC